MIKGPWDNDPEDKGSSAAPWERDPVDGPTKPTEGGWAPRVAREGAPVNRKEAMKEQIRAERAPGSNIISNTLNAASSRLGTGLRSAVGSIPFADDAVAGLATAIPSDFDYSLPAAERFARNRDYVEAQHAVDWEKDPVSTGVGTVGGLLAGPGAKFISNGSNIGTQALRSGVVGGAYAGADGLGSNGTVEERVQRGLSQAPLGAAIGAGFPLAARGIGAVGGQFVDPFVQRYRQWRDPEGAVDRMIAGGWNMDDLAGRRMTDAEIRSADRFGQPVTIGDIGGDATHALARTAANASPVARGTIENVVNPRYQTQNTRFGSFVANLFDMPNPGAMKDRINEAERLVNRRAYDELYDQFPMLFNEKLLGILKVPEVAKAAEDVMARNPGMRAAGMSKGPMSPDIPNAEFWDRVQRELRDKANSASGARAAEVSSLYGGLRRQILDELDTLTGGKFGEVRGGAARFFGAENALEAGQNFFRQNNLNQLDEARQVLARMTPAERRLFSQGFAAEMSHASTGTRDGADLAIQGWLSSPNARDKMALALGEGRAADIQSFIGIEAGMNRMRNAVKGNSTTVRQLIENGAFGLGIGTMTNGFDWRKATSSPESFLIAVARQMATGRKGMSPDMAERLARRLVSNNPADVSRMIQQVGRDRAQRTLLRDLESVITRGASQLTDQMPGGQPHGFAERQAQIDALPEIDPLGPEKALGQGLMEGAQTAGRYLRDTPIRQIPKDVGKVAGMVWEGAKEDPVGFALDMTPVVGEVRSGMDANELLTKAMEAEKAGDPDTAAKLRQLGALATAGAIPAAGMGARAAKRATKGASKAAEVAAEVARVLPDTPHPGTISTRLPTAVKALDDPYTGGLQIDTAAMRAEPDSWAHNVGLVSEYPNLPEAVAKGAPDDVAKAFEDHVVNNLLWLYDQVPPEVRDQSKRWYDGARKLTDKWSEKYQLPDTAVAATLAALSPQKDWYQNVSLAERVLDIYTGKKDFRFSNQMMPTAEQIFGDAKYQPLLDLVKNKTLSELKTPEEKAMWLRIYDETYHDRGHRLVTPEGDFGDYVKTDKGANSGTAWGSLTEIGKAIAALDAKGDHKAITDLMGERHKVRSFYNNILDPNGPRGDVTIDTHAVAAGLLRPLSGNSLEVAQNFKNSLPKQFKEKIEASGRPVVNARGSAITGAHGLYGIYADAYRRAAKERGILPREMQSITWEAVRGLFPDTFKNAKNNAAVDKVWYAYRKGELSLDDARQQISQLAGGINPPSWLGRSDATSGVRGASSYAGELPEAGLHGLDPTGVGPGAGGAAAGAPAGLEPIPRKRGGPVSPRRETHDLDSFIMATAPRSPGRFAMGGPVLPSAVEPRLTRRGALSMFHVK